MSYTQLIFTFFSHTQLGKEVDLLLLLPKERLLDIGKMLLELDLESLFVAHYLRWILSIRIVFHCASKLGSTEHIVMYWDYTQN